jgi:Fe2+ or Zn2+ uptake regulation protein
LLDADRHLTPLEVCEMAHQDVPGMTEATVYRTLNFLTQQGLVLAAHIGNGQLVYEIAERAHHHLICRICGAAQEIDHARLEALYQEFQATTGYQIDSMHVTFFGLCPECQDRTPE